MPDQQPQRLADIRGVQIDITPEALDHYLASPAIAHRGLTRDGARSELREVLLRASVTDAWRDGATVEARCRDTRLGLDVNVRLQVLARTHVRCTHANARKLEVKARRGTDAHVELTVYGHDGKKLGLVRMPRDRAAPATPTSFEYRAVSMENGAPAPPWGPVPEHARAALRQVDRNAKVREVLIDRGFRV